MQIPIVEPQWGVVVGGIMGNVKGLRVGESRQLARGDLPAEASALWRSLPPGSVLWLTGELGAGKTTFVQEITRVAGSDLAHSPTFALVHEYVCGDERIVHADCYRLRTPEEALDLDLHELARRARLLVIEWPEKAGSFAPLPDVEIRLSHCGDQELRLMERRA